MEEVKIGDTIYGVSCGINGKLIVGNVIHVNRSSVNVAFHNNSVKKVIGYLSVFTIDAIGYAKTLLLEKNYLCKHMEEEKEYELREMERELRLDLEDAEEDMEDYDV